MSANTLTRTGARRVGIAGVYPGAAEPGLGYPRPRACPRSAPDGCRSVRADFNWWLVLVGVVLGAALTWLVISETQRRERDVSERELEAEAAWISRTVDTPGLDADRVEQVLRAHRRYLRFPPP